MSVHPSLPPTMPAAVYKGPRRLEVEEIAVPDVGAHDVLVEVSHCGVCGSDLHLVLDGWARPGSVGGHEWTGVVVAVGDAVETWRVGDPVIGGPSVRCGDCVHCRAGRPSLCAGRDTPGTEPHQGAFARYTVAPHNELLPLPDGLDLRTAALTEPLAVALHALTLGGIAPGQRALVTGAGPIGALVVAALRARGVDDVVVSEPAVRRRDLAARLGAEVVTPVDFDVPSAFEPGRVVTDAVDVVFECSGKGPAMEAGLAQLTRGGTLVLVGAGMDRPSFDPNRILLNELVITGAFTYDAGGFDAALDLLGSGSFPVAELVEPDEVVLDGLFDAFLALAGGEIAGKVLVSPGRST